MDTSVFNAPVPAWETRIMDTLKAGQKPAYDDLHNGFVNTIQQLHDTQKILEDMANAVAQMVLARVGGDDLKVMNLLDELIAKNVVIKQTNTH